MGSSVLLLPVSEWYHSGSQDLTPSEFGVRNVYDFTEAVQRIREEVDNRTINDCCSYRFQILDQYCASRTAVSKSIHCSYRAFPLTLHIYIARNPGNLQWTD